MIVKGFFLFTHESDSDGYYIHVLTHLVAQSGGKVQSGDIFFCGDDALRRRHLLKGLVNQLDVFLREVVVVAERQGSYLTGMRLQVDEHLLRRGEA